MTVGQKSEVPDAHESFGQDVQEEPAQELNRLQGHGARLIAVRVVAPTESDALSVKSQ
jgi:hypothetical protein